MAKVARVSPSCVKIAANNDISSSVLSLTIQAAKEEMILTNSQGFGLNDLHLM